MPRPANNDPAVLLERANKERQRWKKAQEKYLERPENATKHKEAVKSYYEKNKEALKAKANERNAKKREANKATAPAKTELPAMADAITQLRKVEHETKKRNMRRKAEAGLKKVAQETAQRNTQRKREASERSAMAMEDKDVVVIPKNEFVEEHKKLVNVLSKGSDAEQAKEAKKQEVELKKAPTKRRVIKAKVTEPAVDPSTIAKDKKSDTLPQATFDALAKGNDTDGYIPEVNTYWQPAHLAEYREALEDLRKETSFSYSFHDHRKRPSWQFKGGKLQSPVELETEAKAKEAEKNGMKRPEWKDKEGNRIYDLKQKRLGEEIAELKSDATAIRKWRPYRAIEFSCHYNDHKANEIIEYLDQNKERPFYTQLKAVVQNRKVYMEEVNKKRSNPIRNVELHLSITPSEVYIEATWNIHRSSNERSSWTIHRLHATEYGLGEFGDKVVDMSYKSEKTLQREAEEKAKAEAEAQAKVAMEEAQKKARDAPDGMAHEVVNGIKIKYKPNMKRNAVYEDYYEMYANDLWDTDSHKEERKYLELINATRTEEEGKSHSIYPIVKIKSQTETHFTMEVVGFKVHRWGKDYKSWYEAWKLPTPFEVTKKKSRTKEMGLIIPKYVKPIRVNEVKMNTPL